MNTRTTILLLTFGLAACGSKDDKAATSGSGSAAAKPAADKRAPIDEALATQIASTQIDGFEATNATPKKTGATVVYTTKSAPPISVVVNLDKCEMCQRMDVALWKSNANLKSMLSSASSNDPGLVWEVDGVDLGGKQGIYTYALAYSESEDGKSRGGVNSYNIWFNDGVNQLWMQTSCNQPFADTVKDEASLAATCPREQQLAAAKQVFAAFAPYF